MAAGNGTPIGRTLKMIARIIRHPVDWLRSNLQRDVANRSVILLIMQSLNNAMRMKLKKGILGNRLSFVNDKRSKVPSYIPIGQEVLHRYSAKVNGVPQNAFSEVMFGLATTAHIMGGCPMGQTSAEGVVNERFEVNGYKNFYILDGSVIPCNLGVNPSLTITALSEYAMSLIPNHPEWNGETLEKLMRKKAGESEV
jgi:cholesterol oxidase